MPSGAPEYAGHGELPTAAMVVLAVLNDHIRPLINIQNRRNKQTFDTYAFTIDIVPLVLEDSCFVG